MGEMGRVREKTEVVYETSERYAQRVVVVDAELGLFVAQVVDHDACEVGDAYRMLLARMRRRRVHERAPTQLLDLADGGTLGITGHFSGPVDVNGAPIGLPPIQVHLK